MLKLWTSQRERVSWFLLFLFISLSPQTFEALSASLWLFCVVSFFFFFMGLLRFTVLPCSHPTSVCYIFNVTFLFLFFFCMYMWFLFFLFLLALPLLWMNDISHSSPRCVHVTNWSTLVRECQQMTPPTTTPHPKLQPAQITHYM